MNVLATPPWHYGALALDLGGLLLAILVASQRQPQQKVLWVLVFAGAAVGFAGGTTTTIGYATVGVLALLTGVWARVDGLFDASRWRARSVNPIELQSPFRDAWRVAAGGADPRHNHHQVVGDQYFAYDFLREEGPEWEQEILAPCDGTIAWTEDRHEDAEPGARRRDGKNPAGNYVSIETPRGFVILAHLRKQSIAVLPGIAVKAGEPVGRCGNSGNTSRSHLHVHAQDRPQVAPGIAEGIPIAFLDRDGQAWILDYGDVLEPSAPPAGR